MAVAAAAALATISTLQFYNSQQEQSQSFESKVNSGTAPSSFPVSRAKSVGSN